MLLCLCNFCKCQSFLSHLRPETKGCYPGSHFAGEGRFALCQLQFAGSQYHPVEFVFQRLHVFGLPIARLGILLHKTVGCRADAFGFGLGEMCLTGS